MTPLVLTWLALAADPIVPLFARDTKLEPATVEMTATALVTRVGDRVRDRHAREGEFHAYDHYLPLYWENRSVGIEIVDGIAKGGDGITFTMTSLVPLNKPNLRLFFEGRGTVAQYAHNAIATQFDPLHYTLTVKHNPLDRRPIRVGDRIEMEFSPFLLPPVKGRTNYYGTALLYVVGQGIVPWEGRGPRNDSFPLPEVARLGGLTTQHQHFSDEPKERYKQMATNVAPSNAQPFLLGRRLHHTDFGTGRHSESGNPVYAEVTGLLGAHFSGRGCSDCHTNNGRAIPPAVGAPLRGYLVRVAADARGTPHPLLGSTLQTQASAGKPEATVTLAGWTTTEGQYGDGTPFTLRQPRYQFAGVAPGFYSVRSAPPLVGQGLLEAIDEATVAGLVDPKTGRVRRVTDPETNEPRLGRYGWKAGQARLKHQIAAALNNDMGVPSTIYPTLDRGSEQAAPAATKPLPAADLENLYRYVALLGVPPRRDYADAEVVRGEKLFASVGCATCHVPEVKTSAYHPLAELRNQTIRPYTDLLLHDLGPGLADNLAEGDATGAEWRTPPLWGIGLTAGVSGGAAYLHDGRARSLAEAILWHGGTGEKAREAFRTLPAADRAALLRFLHSL